MGRRRQALPRLCGLLGTGDPRTCARRHRARGAGGGALRLVVRGADRSRGRARRNAVRPVALARPGAARELGYGGDDERAAPRARPYRSGQDRQVRGLLSRPRRQPAGQGRLGRAHLRPALVGRRPAGDRRRDDRALVQRPRGRGRGIRRAPRRHCLHHRRAGRGQHEPDPAGAGVSAGPAGAVRSLRRGADFRRGDDRIPGASVRGAGSLRRATRSHHAGQGDRWRHAGGRVWR